MLRGTGAAVKPTSQCFTFFSGGEKKTWQKKGKCEVFSHSLIEQAVLAGIKWINVKSDSLTKPHERHKPTRGLENSSVGIMNRVQLEILLAVQLGALHARSYWALQYWAEGKLSTLSLMSKTWVVWGAIMWGGGKSCSPSNLRMRDLTRSQVAVCLPVAVQCGRNHSGRNTLNSKHALWFTACTYLSIWPGKLTIHISLALTQMFSANKMTKVCF